MAKCPKCGGELTPQENGLWQCSACGKLFRIKQKTTPESTQGADVPPVNGSGADVPPVQTTPVTPAAPTQEERSQAAEIEELKRRLAEMERRQSEQQPASHSGAAASAAAVKFAPVVEFLKKYGLKVVLPVTLLVVAFIILCACFMGLRGIYVNVDNPNEFISFNATNYEWYYNSMLGETVDKGTWSKSGNTLNFVVDDELFGEVEDPYDVTNFSWNGFTLVDSFGAEKRYERVSLICYKDNISKVTVTFDLNGGTGSGGGEQKFRIGSIATEPETPTRDGYIFRGWYTSADSWKTGEGRSYQPGVREWESATYYANWQSATQFEMYCEYFENEVEPFYEGDSLMDVFMRGMGDDGVTSNDMLEGIFFYEGSAQGWTARPLESDIAPAHNVRLPYISDFENLTIIVDGKLYSVVSDAAEYTIPDIVTDIGEYAFDDYDNLTSITIPDSVTSIENGALWGNKLVEVYNKSTLDITAGTDQIKNVYTEEGGSWFTDTADGFRFFYDGTDGYLMGYYGDKTAITLPNSFTAYNGMHIGEYVIYDSAFRGSTGLTAITIPDSVTSIGRYAFWDCTGLTSLEVDENNTAYASVDGILYNKAKTEFIHIPDALAGDITIPNGVTSIGSYAFNGYTGLTSVTIPDSVTSIGDDAFSWCTGLTSVTIPDSVTSIGDSAFNGCNNLEYNEYDNAYYLGSETNPHLVLIKAKDTAITSCAISKRTQVISGGAFYYCTGLTSITIPDSVTSIGNSAFWGCTGLTSITIPDSVTSIGNSAFWGCTGLTSITIPDSVTSIGSDAFWNCTGLTSITIGNGVTSIGGLAFGGCSGLMSVTIPDSVTSIGSDAFWNCTGLTSVTFEGSVEEWNAIDKGYSWKYNCPFTEVVCSDGTVQV